jgi:hypothetical protein
MIFRSTKNGKATLLLIPGGKDDSPGNRRRSMGTATFTPTPSRELGYAVLKDLRTRPRIETKRDK